MYQYIPGIDNEQWVFTCFLFPVRNKVFFFRVGQFRTQRDRYHHRLFECQAWWRAMEASAGNHFIFTQDQSSWDVWKNLKYNGLFISFVKSSGGDGQCTVVSVYIEISTLVVKAPLYCINWWLGITDSWGVGTQEVMAWISSLYNLIKKNIFFFFYMCLHKIVHTKGKQNSYVIKVLNKFKHSKILKLHWYYSVVILFDIG